MKAGMLKNIGYVVVGILVVYGLYKLFSRYEGFSSGNTFTLYYADWCPHCKTVKPAFESWMYSQNMVTAKMYEADRDSAEVQAAGV